MAKQGQDKPEPNVRKRRPKWPWVLVAIAVVLILVLILVPVVLSSGRFTRWVQAKIDRSTGGQTNIGNLSVGWFSGVRVADFSFREPNGWAQVDIDRITAMPSYSGLLSGTLALDHAEIDQPRLVIDLRERPVSTAKQPSFDVSQLERLHDLVVRDASVRLTDTAGQTVQLADLNADLRVRPPGQTSTFDATTVVANQSPGRIRASGQVTPGRKTRWSLRGTSGDITMEVNDLNLGSITPFLELAGVRMQAQGQVSGNLTGALQNGQIQNLVATISGQDIDITGPALQGDEVRTAQLSVRADLAQAKDVIEIGQLNVRTDWATVSATGTIPKTPQSLNQLLESGAAYKVNGNFDVNLAALLSQLPNTLHVPAGTQVTGGRATGSLSTTTEAGRATLVAEAQVTGLAGLSNNQKVALSGPVVATARLSTGKEGAQLDALDVSAPFAKVAAHGTFQQIQYQGQADLGLLQTDLGPFISLGSYKVAGQVASQGQISIEPKATGVTGTLSARQLTLAAPDGNSVSEPQADVSFAVAMHSQDQVLAVNALTVNADFGTIDIKNGTVPLGPKAAAPLNLVVLANNVDLNRLKPYAVFFASFPKELTVAGIAQSQATVTAKQGIYHIVSTATRIQDFRLESAGKEPFAQPQVTALFDVYLDPNQKTIDVQSLQVDSPQIKIRKAEFRRTRQDDMTRAQGTLDGQVDWAAASRLASAFLPAQLTITGQRPIAINFTSTYPTSQPNGLLAHLNTQTALGFDRVQYIGFDVGPTELDLRAENGLLRIAPLSTAVNNGRLNFSGQADLRQTPPVLTTPTPLHLVQNIQINQQTTDRLLKYVNPIFANVVDVTGIANFDLQRAMIPLAAGAKDKAELTGTLWIDQLRLGASGILNQILGVTGQSVRGQILTVRPTNLVLQNGVVRYADMEIDVGDNPLNFRGSVGLNGALDLTIVLPYTIEGRTVRVGQAEAAQRIVVPLTGTISQPKLNLQDLLKSQLQGQIQRGLEELFKKR
jgi:hypothetical protein